MKKQTNNKQPHATTNANNGSPIYTPESENLPGNEKSQTTPKTNDVYEVYARCGFWVCAPDFVQPCATVGCFTAFMSLAGLMTQTLTYYVNSQVTTLERQFGFNSYQTGIIMAANDIGYLVCVLFVGYMATKSHIPRSLGAAVITYAVSGIACALPHFLFGAQFNADRASGDFNTTSFLLSQQSKIFGSLCDVNNTWAACENSSARNTTGPTSIVTSARLAEISLVIIVVGMALQGFAKAPRTSFVVTYLDDNTAKHSTGLYMGVVMGMSFLGPALAYLMGGVFTRMYVTLEATQLTPRHPRWIGAWWLGYVVFGLLSLVVAVPLFCFPRRLPRNITKDIRSKDDTTARKSEVKSPTLKEPPLLQKSATGKQPAVKRTSLGDRLKFLSKHSREFLASLFRLLTNPVYACVVLFSCCTLFSVAGVSAFSSKYLESMFHLPTHTANFVMAAQTMSTAFVGSFLGGYLSKRLKMTAMTGIQFNMATIAITLLAQMLALIFQCDQPTVHNWPSENNSCNSGCGCRDNSYFPVCGGDGRTYYSPCHAGCVEAEQGVYQNCSCIPGGHATGGTCDYSCSQLYAYVVMMGIRHLTNTLAIIPMLVICIRCVSEKDKAMALSVQTFMISVLGWLLAPILVGNAIDKTCRIWDIKCQTQGRCLLYDNDLFRLNLNGYSALGLALSLIFLVISYIYARHTKCLDEVVKDGAGQENAEMAAMVKGKETGTSTGANETAEVISEEQKETNSRT